MISEQVTVRKLNVGCGTDVRSGWVNMDVVKLPGVDVVHDIQEPLPFADDTFEEILCQDVLEHVAYIPVLRELLRVLRPGGRLRIRVPHFTCKNNFVDPTHRHLFSWRTFGFFTRNSLYGRHYYFDFSFSHIENARITFSRGYYVYNYVMEPLVNLTDRTRDVYEETMLSRLFPALNIELDLRK